MVYRMRHTLQFSTTRPSTLILLAIQPSGRRDWCELLVDSDDDSDHTQATVLVRYTSPVDPCTRGLTVRSRHSLSSQRSPARKPMRLTWDTWTLDARAEFRTYPCTLRTDAYSRVGARADHVYPFELATTHACRHHRHDPTHAWKVGVKPVGTPPPVRGQCVVRLGRSG